MFLDGRGGVDSDKERGDDGSDICHGNDDEEILAETKLWITPVR